MASDGCAGSSPARGTESNKRTKETTQACLYVVSFVLLLCFCKWCGWTPIGSPAPCNSHKSPSTPLRKFACMLSLLFFYCAFASGAVGLPSEVPPLATAINPLPLPSASLLVSCLYCSFIGFLQVLRRDSHRKSRPLFHPLFHPLSTFYPPLVHPLSCPSALLPQSPIPLSLIS